MRRRAPPRPRAPPGPAPPPVAAGRPGARRRPGKGKCRHDFVTVIAEGAASKEPPLLSLTQMLWIAQAVRSARPHAAPSDFLVFGLGLGAPCPAPSSGAWRLPRGPKNAGGAAPGLAADPGTP
jgi:hypothetical protein